MLVWSCSLWCRGRERTTGLLGHVKDWQQRAALLGSGVATAGRGGMSVLAIDELVEVEKSKQKVN